MGRRHDPCEANMPVVVSLLCCHRPRPAMGAVNANACDSCVVWYWLMVSSVCCCSPIELRGRLCVCRVVVMDGRTTARRGAHGVERRDSVCTAGVARPSNRMDDEQWTTRQPFGSTGPAIRATNREQESTAFGCSQRTLCRVRTLCPHDAGSRGWLLTTLSASRWWLAELPKSGAKSQ